MRPSLSDGRPVDPRVDRPSGVPGRVLGSRRDLPLLVPVRRPRPGPRRAVRFRGVGPPRQRGRRRRLRGLAAGGRRRHRSDVPPVLQQARPGARDAALRASTSTVSCSPWPAPATPARRSTSRACAASWPAPGCRRRTCRTPPTCRTTTTSGGRGSPSGRPASALAQNCSGKHAAMLATCVVERLGPGDVPRPRAPAAAGRWSRPWSSWPASRWPPPGSTAAAPPSWRSR